MLPHHSSCVSAIYQVIGAYCKFKEEVVPKT